MPFDHSASPLCSRTSHAGHGHGSRRTWACRHTATLVVGLLTAMAAQAQYVAPVGSAIGEQISRDSAAARTVARIYQGTFDYVRIESQEDGAAANLHPMQIEPEDLAKLLASVRMGQRALFNQDDLDEITPHLARALEQATATQDVSFAVAGKHSAFGLIAPRDVTTGRLFNTANGLQLIVGLAHKPFEDRFRATGVLIAFEPGRRAAPVDASLSLRLAAGAAGRMQRPDWATLPTTATAQAAAVAPPPSAAMSATVPTATAAAQASAATAPPVSAAATATPATATPATATPATAVPPALAPAPATPASHPGPDEASALPIPALTAPTMPAPAGRTAALPAADAEARFREASERLKIIERLRQGGLITQKEYEEKRKQVLQGL